MIPPAESPTLIPNPSMCSGLFSGAVNRADSAPRTQCGTLTGIVRTLLNPSRFMVSSAHAMARGRESDPLSRLPMRSHR